MEHAVNANVRLWSLNSSDHGFTERETIVIFNVLPRFDHCSWHGSCRSLGLQLSFHFSLCFLLSRPYVSCTPYSPFASVQVCCTRERLGFLYPSCLFLWPCPCLHDRLTFTFRLPSPLKPLMQALWTSMDIWSAASARRSTTSALICA